MENPTPGRANALARFGIYEADRRSGELRKNGVKLRLQEQPFQILMVLLERAGEVVTREELRQRLWSNDTFVDFDHGLNTAINKLRDALSDTASNPRFVETLARRGYRFIAPVEWITPGSELAGQRAGAAGEPVAVKPLPTVPAPPPPPSAASDTGLPRPHRGLTRLLFVLAQLMYLIFYAVALWRLDHIRAVSGLWLTNRGWIVAAIVLISGCVGIAVRLYLTTAVLFDYPGLGRSFRRIFPLVLPLDQLWALAPFLLLGQIGVGAAFAACAALLYLPFSERTLIRMAYDYR